MYTVVQQHLLKVQTCHDFQFFAHSLIVNHSFDNIEVQRVIQEIVCNHSPPSMEDIEC